MDHGTYDEIQSYCARVSADEPDILYRQRRATHLRCIHPRMISGPYLGRVLSMISKLVSPDRILEVGTFTGYSTLCLAEGLNKNGSIITIEKNDELKSIQKEFFDQSPVRDRIDNRFGDALDILPNLEQKFQLIFLDADKESYHLYLPWLLELSDKNAVILIDNMLWEGKVLFEEFTDEQTESIRKLTAMVKENERLEQVLLPVRDGLMMLRVKSI